MKITEIRKIIKISQEMGLKRIKIDTFEAEFFELTQPKQLVGVPELTHSDIGLVPRPEIADEAEMLFWSAGGLEDDDQPKQ
jgi:hypothetical protein